VTSYQDALVSFALLLRFDKKTVLPVYVLRTHFYVYRYAYVYFARSVVNMQHSIACKK